VCCICSVIDENELQGCVAAYCLLRQSTTLDHQGQTVMVTSSFGQNESNANNVCVLLFTMLSNRG
jgi:hypothetical protein